jgi:hypothetical protein
MDNDGPLEDPVLMLMRLECDALTRHFELESIRRLRLEARVAGRVDQVVTWCESADEEDDDETLAALRAFRPMAWWNEED